MCTVIYIPVKEGILFLSNRDESPERPMALAPEIYSTDEIKYICPIDPQGGGTWVGANGNGDVIILLNGGYEKHVRKESYVRSRGLIVKELLAKPMPVIQFSLLNLNGIEPFTLIIWSEGNLFQLVWDGANKHRAILSPKEAHIFSSAPLYPIEVREMRRIKFTSWLQTQANPDAASLLEFILSDQEPQHGFIMNRNEKVKTLSTTVLQYSSNEVCFQYKVRDKAEITSVLFPFETAANISCPLPF